MRRTIPLIIALCACSRTPADKGPSAIDTAHRATSGSVRILSYNVHGLPSLITGDDTSGRMERIAPLLKSWDWVGLQEDWDGDNHETLVEQTEHTTKLWFDETVSADRYYGSGLSVLAEHPAVEVVNTHYSTCSGTLDGASDCLASKGFQAARIQVGAGTIDLYNTHFEAGGGEEDNLARSTQVSEVIDALNGWSAGHAIVFTGDFNLRASDPEDLPEIERLESTAGLIDACASVGCDEPDHIDKVYVRDGENMKLTVQSWSNESDAFLDEEGTDLSDHPPISAEVSWSVVN